MSNTIINKILNEAIEKSLGLGGIVIDGTPRSYNQIIDIDELLSLYNKKIDLAIFIDTTIEECKKRISLRTSIEKRVDDTPPAIEQRLKIYFEETVPIINEFEKRGILLKINGNPSEEIVWNELRQKVKEYFLL